MVAENSSGSGGDSMDSVRNSVPDVALTGYICQRCKTIFQSESPYLFCGECSGRIQEREAWREVNRKLDEYNRCKDKVAKWKRRRDAANAAYYAAFEQWQELVLRRPK